ncbi:Protein of unknown function [Pyronema omphalodes CBS 100304]|uniref:Uncharacterized protein n=1 Tax=Pyronema omphalodes (strain CBS 100304) TaxID=1076935 RepID=U4LKR3_PYROM|nr:Protein of unknown function [Pyronema omphalodes CBS 100304]
MKPSPLLCRAFFFTSHHQLPCRRACSGGDRATLLNPVQMCITPHLLIYPDHSVIDCATLADPPFPASQQAVLSAEMLS